LLSPTQVHLDNPDFDVTLMNILQLFCLMLVWAKFPFN
jgi:hypothetical protein